jgi:hypothetical protein
MPKKTLSAELLKFEAQKFAMQESGHKEKALFGVTDGKAVGTYLEHKFQESLQAQFEYVRGNSAKGIDFPDLKVDIKVTSIRQPQSSCPFKSARQKIYGLGYSLLVFVYDKKDDRKSKTSTLTIKHVIFLEPHRTSDFQTTSGIIKILDNAGNSDDLVGFMMERFLPVDEVQAEALAEEILKKKPELGYLTISPALQWRLGYKRVIQYAGKVTGVNLVV